MKLEQLQKVADRVAEVYCKEFRFTEANAVHRFMDEVKSEAAKAKVKPPDMTDEEFKKCFDKV